MRLFNLVLHLPTCLVLFASASPMPQPQGAEDFVPIVASTDAPSYVVPTTSDSTSNTEEPILTIQISTPATTTTPDGTIYTVQTPTTQASPTETEVQVPEDDGDEWCDSDDDDGVPVSESPSPTPTIIDPGYPISTPEPPFGLAPGVYQIYPVRALISMCLSIVDGVEPADGTPVVMQVSFRSTLRHKLIPLHLSSSTPCDGRPAQNWEVVPAQWYPPAGNVYIKLAGTNYCLDASFPLGDYTSMKIWTCYDGLVQQKFNYALDSSLYLVDQGQCLDLRDGNIDIDAVVQTWECVSGNSNQHWFVIPKTLEVPK